MAHLSITLNLQVLFWGGYRLHIQQVGKGPPVVFLHGMIGSRDKLMKYENLTRIPPRVEIRVIDGATHHLPLSHPGEILRLLDD